ncbi:hypothetical protein R84B8_00701 [Treponema sp. R8-4-B8]
MKSRKIWMPVLLIALAFALTLAGCDLGDLGNGDDNTTVTVATPTANTVTGTYATGKKVTLSTSTTDADIYYTTDGSAPTTSNYKYDDVASSGGVELTASGTTPAVITLKAIAYVDNSKSDVLTLYFKVIPGTPVTVAASGDSGAGTLRNAIDNATDNTTIIIDPSVKKIELASNLIVKNTGITIEGNGVVLTQVATWSVTNQSLFQTNSGKSATVSRVHFNNGKDLGTGNAGNGGAIYNIGSLTLESCIFSYNSAIRGGAIFNTPAGTGVTLTVKGCTFLANSTKNAPTTGTNSTANKGAGGAIYNDGGQISFTGNLFYNNTAEALLAPGTGATANFMAPILFNTNSGGATSGGYNVTDVAYGVATGASGWTNGTGDKTFWLIGMGAVDDLDMDEGVAPIDTTTFAPKDKVRGVIPSAITGFPAVDFNGEVRTFPGAAGAVK